MSLGLNTSATESCDSPVPSVAFAARYTLPDTATAALGIMLAVAVLARADHTQIGTTD
jgi:hypothetical protein